MPDEIGAGLKLLEMIGRDRSSPRGDVLDNHGSPSLIRTVRSTLSWRRLIDVHAHDSIRITALA
jgi:hypothetical protein